MTVITHLNSAVRSHEAVSVQAYLRSKLCRNQNKLVEGLANMSGITHLNSAVHSHEVVSVQAHICNANVKRSGRNQNRSPKMELPT